MGKEMGDVANGFWFAAGYTDGIFRIWAVETARCVATLHPMFHMHDTFGGCVSVAPGRSRVVQFIAPHPRNLGGNWRIACMGYRPRDTGEFWVCARLRKPAVI
jgi:hypothetical protein